LELVVLHLDTRTENPPVGGLIPPLGIIVSQFKTTASGGDATVYVDTDGNTLTAKLSFTLTGVTILTQGDNFIL